MSEETTKNIPDTRSFEERVFARFDAMDARFNTIDVRFDRIEDRLTKVETRLDGLASCLTTLEERVDRRLMETRPIWEAMQEQLENLSDKLDRLNTKFDIIASDLYEMRADIKSLDKRVTRLEDSTPQ